MGKKLPESLLIEAEARFEPLQYECRDNVGIVRSYDCRNFIYLTFRDTGDDGQCMVATAELRICDYPDVETMVDVADENGDSLEAALAAYNYIGL